MAPSATWLVQIVSRILCTHLFPDMLQSMSMSLLSWEYECWTVVLVLLVSWLLLGGHRTIYLLYHTLPRDLV